MHADDPAPASPSDPDDHAAALLARSRTVAVVGFSADASKPSNRAPMELVERGWDVIAVNPFGEVAGVPTVADLRDIDRHVDLVDVFRPAADAPGIARAAAQIGASALWLQLGIRSPEAREIAREHDMAYVEDQCVAPIARRFDLHPPALDAD